MLICQRSKFYQSNFSQPQIKAFLNVLISDINNCSFLLKKRIKFVFPIKQHSFHLKSMLSILMKINEKINGKNLIKSLTKTSIIYSQLVYKMRKDLNISSYLK